MPTIPSELRKAAEEGFYVVVGVGVAGAHALRQKVRTLPYGDKAAEIVQSAATQLARDVVREGAGALRAARELAEYWRSGGGPRPAV